MTESTCFSGMSRQNRETRVIDQIDSVSGPMLRKAAIASRRLALLLLVGLGILLSDTADLWSAAKPVKSAARIIELWGRDQGLCSIIGIRTKEDALLAANLAAKGTILVHGLARDDNFFRQALRIVTERGVDGFATIEKLPLNPLPYRDNLVNLMVVPDPADAARAGFTKAEAFRALAPLGKLCVFENGEWNVTEKPMPKEMDEWTHNVHGPDGNRASNDTVVRFPVGYRWHGGLPFNINNVKRQGNRYSSTRAMAVAGGRCFTFSDSVLENLKDAYFLGQNMDQYVTARDAFSGLFLWRKRIGHVYYGGLWYMNMAPFAVTDNMVCTVSEKGDLLILDAATGKEIRTLDTTFAPGEILISDGVLVAATWKNGTWVGESKRNFYERRLMHSAVSDGTVEAYDLASGEKLWLRKSLATSIRSVDGLLFLIQRQGADALEESLWAKPPGQPKVSKPNPKPPVRPRQTVVAVDLKTGKSQWEVTAASLSPEQYQRESLRLDAVGLGVATVVHEGWGGIKVSVLSAQDGRCLLQKTSKSFPVLIDGAVHLAGRKYDPATGKELGPSPYSLSSTVCTPSYVVNDMIVMNRGGAFRVGGKTVLYGGARGACSVASVPACGAFYTPQNWCLCCPPQISGFICFGPVRSVPTDAEMTAAVEPEKGPAFANKPATGNGADDDTDSWPMVRNDATRCSGTSATAPTTLDEIWRCKLSAPDLSAPLAVNWCEYLNAPLTGPTVADGVVTTAVMDANQVVGLDLKTGKQLWRFTAGARIDSAPTRNRGLCLFGAHDGVVYALEARNGGLKWKMRIAPREERMVSYGKVESPWPVIGSVLVDNGMAYASAGRTQGSDGGIVVRAFDPMTGKLAWSHAISPSNNLRELRRNDLLVKVSDSLQLMITRLDCKTGERLKNTTRETVTSLLRLNRNVATQKHLLQGAKTEEDKSRIQKAITELEEQLKELAASESEIALSLGAGGSSCEGLVHWNWPRLGNRKYRQMNYGNVGGALVSWDETAVARMTQDHVIALRAMKDVGPASENLKSGDRWTVSLPKGCQATSLVVCRNAVITAGGVYSSGNKTSAKGFVRVLSRENGETLAACEFPVPVAYNGIAVLNRKVCVALENSTVCLVGEPIALTADILSPQLSQIRKTDADRCLRRD